MLDSVNRDLVKEWVRDTYKHSVGIFDYDDALCLIRTLRNRPYTQYFVHILFNDNVIINHDKSSPSNKSFDITSPLFFQDFKKALDCILFNYND